MKKSCSSRVLSSHMIFLKLKRTTWPYCPSHSPPLTRKQKSPQVNGVMNKNWPLKHSKRLSLPMLRTCGSLLTLTQGVKTVSYCLSSGRSWPKSRKERKERLNSVMSISQSKKTGKSFRIIPRVRSCLKLLKSPSTVKIRRVPTFIHETSQMQRACTHGFLVTLIILDMATGDRSSIRVLM